MTISEWIRSILGGPDTSLLPERVDVVLQQFICSHVKLGSGSYHAQNLTISFLRMLLPEANQYRPRQGEWLTRWENRDVPNDLKTVARRAFQSIHSRLDQLRTEQEELQREENGRKVAMILAEHAKFIERFFEIAYLRVAVPDEYGDEKPSAFDDEMSRFLTKLAAKEPCLSQRDPYSMFNRYPVDMLLRDALRGRFWEYYSQRKATVAEIDPAMIAGMSGMEFESYLAGLLRSAGVEDVSSTPSIGDQGADLIFSYRGRRFIVQAKRWKASVGNKAVQEAHAAKGYYRCDEAWVVTNSKFTQSARTLAQELCIVLVDSDSLVRFRLFVKNRLGLPSA
jgi:restriction system protein